jgi:hypothetical protein
MRRRRNSPGSYTLAIAIPALLLSSACRKPESPAVASGSQAPTAPRAVEPPVVEDGFTLLSLADFEAFAGEADTWHDEAGVIVCSGKPKGYSYSRRPYRNFTLRCDYRFATPAADADPEKSALANTGFMVHIQQPHKVWPRSLEVQGRWDQMASIKSNGGVPELLIHDDPTARETARKPVGEWNSVEVVSRDGTLAASLNGQQICRSETGELTAGLIGLQSELFEVTFRNLRIRED